MCIHAFEFAHLVVYLPSLLSSSPAYPSHCETLFSTSWAWSMWYWKEQLLYGGTKVNRCQKHLQSEVASLDSLCYLCPRVPLLCSRHRRDLHALCVHRQTNRRHCRCQDPCCCHCLAPCRPHNQLRHLQI
ncbi:uncharacterized protein EV420DRAFT_1562094 [Desarmillaria tabescens]|uniref:Secreted protein n=1 Tax=Armillaria tabescens TaxID=1929756 RepID=A0AA39JZT8_ARMTA|nr:uncharacterized protein EV420DRAFT_1562094 [Desarmillaria tabescens]KAK0450504.1 hypothetical protein EV420DRAFT_1562094 [Desarmillaria tabescens]